jgi:hypothetical protein
MSYAQWNQYTQYIVGNQVVNLGVLYKCILAVGPTATAPAADATHWTNLGAPTGSLPSGLTPANTLTWAPVGTSPQTYTATLTGVSPLLTTTSRLSTTLQLASGYVGSDVVASENCWLITQYPSSANGGSITFYCADNPVTYPKILFSWAIAGF